MITKKQKKSSRKNVENRRTFKYLQNISVNSRFADAKPVQTTMKTSGRAASIKRASGRGD